MKHSCSAARAPTRCARSPWRSPRTARPCRGGSGPSASSCARPPGATRRHSRNSCPPWPGKQALMPHCSDGQRGTLRLLMARHALWRSFKAEHGGTTRPRGWRSPRPAAWCRSAWPASRATRRPSGRSCSQRPPWTCATAAGTRPCSGPRLQPRWSLRRQSSRRCCGPGQTRRCATGAASKWICLPSCRLRPPLQAAAASAMAAASAPTRTQRSRRSMSRTIACGPLGRARRRSRGSSRRRSAG
mmetsp:Transcript_18903/g.56905  ORF Transcript_18903/g.56905 Transcript_18903/m.56905 type:complete len:244 (+) Transcript_18903:191-922(+)